MLQKPKKDAAETASEPSTEPATEVQTGTEVGSGTQTTVTKQFPWAELERCGSGLIDVIKTEPGKPLGTHTLSSRPFELEAKFGSSTFKANFTVKMDIVIYVDRYDVTTVVDVHEPSNDIKTMMFAARAAGIGVPPWTITTKATLPSFEEFEAVNDRLGWEKAPCSLIPVRGRSTESQGITKNSAYDPGLPEILNPTATLAQLKEEIGASREFPPVESKEWKGSNEAGAVASSVVIKVSEVQPTEDELKALGVTSPPSELVAYAFQRTTNGEAPSPRNIVLFDAKTGKSLGSVFQYADPSLVKPGIVGLPPIE